MPGKNLRQAAATLVQQVQARVQSLLADITSLEVSTYGVDAPHLERVAATEDVTGLAQRHGYTRVTFKCDVSGCTETGRTDDVDTSVRPMHSAAVAQALAGRETLLDAVREALPG